MPLTSPSMSTPTLRTVFSVNVKVVALVICWLNGVGLVPSVV